MYTSDETKDEKDWMKIFVSNVNQTSATLSGLDEDKTYVVRILPRLYDGSYEDRRKITYRINIKGNVFVFRHSLNLSPVESNSNLSILCT